jgi:hypothetical protein
MAKHPFPGKHKIDTHDGLKENVILERLEHLGKGGCSQNVAAAEILHKLIPN